MRARVLLALAFFQQHKVNQALQAITEALRLAAPERFIRPFQENRPHLAPLLALALKVEKLNQETHTFIQEMLGASQGNGGASPISRAEIDALSTSASISRREQEVLDLLSDGYTNHAIALKLCISGSTVKTHLGHIYEKLGVNSRVQAVKVAKELLLVR